MELKNTGFEVTVCVTPDAELNADEKLHDFELALRTQLERLESACGSAIVTLRWSAPQHAYRRFEIVFSKPCSGGAIAFAVDAAAVATGVAVPDGTVTLHPNGDTLKLSPEVDRPCDVADGAGDRG